MDLSAYISFAVRLDNSGVTPALVLTDTSSYPPGVAPTVKGCFTAITEPDGVTIGNSNFSSPDIQWTGAGLNQFSTELRLNTVNSFQQGGYSITYQVQATGYTTTTLVITFNIAYTKPTAVIVSNFNNFQPSLTVTDGTVYTGLAGLTVISTTYNWTATINSVNGTPKNIGSTNLVFDLAYTGNYYDANYAVTMTAITSWSVSNAVTLIDKFSLSQSFDSETPPAITTLLAQLTLLKVQLDTAIANCTTYSTFLSNYLLAQAVYQHLQARGCIGDLAGLSSYVYQLQYIFNNNVTPAVTHTNLPIPAYSFGCQGGGSTSWSAITGKPATAIITWTVGVTPGMPGPGANSVTDARLAGFNVLILRNNLQELGFTKVLASSTVTFNNAFSANEVIYIQSIPI